MPMLFTGIGSSDILFIDEQIPDHARMAARGVAREAFNAVVASFTGQDKQTRPM